MCAIVNIFSHKVTKRFYQLGIIIPVVVYILVMLILKNNDCIKSNFCSSLIIAYSNFTAGLQVMFVNLNYGVSLKKALYTFSISVTVMSVLTTFFIYMI